MRKLVALIFCFLAIGFAKAQTPTPAANPDLIPTCPLDIIFVLDESGSITGSGSATNVVGTLRNAAKGLVTALNGTGSRLAVVEFNTLSRRAVIGGTTAYQTINDAYVTAFNSYVGPDNNSSPSANNYDPEDYSSGALWTNWEAAFNTVSNINTNDGVAPLVIFFTDGKPTAYINSGGGTTSGNSSSVTTQALNEAIVAANVVKAQGSHIFVLGLPNPDLPEANVIAISGPDKYPIPQGDFTKGDYTVSSSQTLIDDLIHVAGLVCKSDLRLAKTASPTVSCAGSTVVFTLTVTNDGLENTTGVEVKDYLPNGYNYVSDNGGAATSFAAGTLTWNVGNLNNAESKQLQITVTVNAGGNYKNVAEVTASSKPDPDSTPGNYDGAPLEDDEAEFTVQLLNCDDQNACTVDACVNSECTYEPVDCNDGNLCTTDACVPATGCVYTPVICDDQNACTNDNCSPTVGCFYTPVNCDDENACTNDACTPSTGCVYTPVNCDDEDACTTDSCHPVHGCKYTAVVCDDDNECTRDACDSETGCVYYAIGCDDQNACTIDGCNSLTGCTYTPVNCDDQNACTNDACYPYEGCVYTPVNCDDQNACTTDACLPHLGCKYTAVNCNDQNACTTDACNPATGCVYTPVNCDDQNACTNDACLPHFGCKYTPVNCDDGIPCTVDACHPATGCVNTPGELDIDIQKQDMSCRCLASQNQLCLIDFAGLAHGEVLDNQYAAYGVSIFAKPTLPSPVIRPVVFNSDLNGTDDPDLEVNIGNIMIIPVEQNSADPDDDPNGGEITIAFDSDRTVLSFDFVDQDQLGCDCVVEAYDVANNLIKTVPIPFAGDASVQTVFVNASGVRKLVFRFNDSGGVGNIRFQCDEPCCDGSATAYVSGGVSPNKYYTWSDGESVIGSSQTIDGLCPGTYYLTVIDGNECSATDHVTIENPSDEECSDCVLDCAFVCNGDAYLDGCGQCVGGTTGQEPCTCYLRVNSLTLMYEGTLGEVGPLTNGTVINRDVLCRVNVRADLCQSPVGSVKFVLNGSTVKIENAAPYAFWGDVNGSYKVWIPQGGNHTLVVTAYSGLNATGTAGVPYVVNFSVTGNQNSNACKNAPSICPDGCNDNNACTTDACVNGTCVYTPINCNDNDVCTSDACVNGTCVYTPIQGSGPSYLRVVNTAKSWRKLKLGYDANSLFNPKQNVTAGGNNQICITLRALGTPEWNKIQVRPQGTSNAVTLSNYINGAVPDFTTICIPLNAFAGFNGFNQLTFIEIPYSNGANAFEIHIAKIEFTGGATPFLWFGDPKTNNANDGQSGDGSALFAQLIPGLPCGAAPKLSQGDAIETFALTEEVSLFAFPNPFKEQVTITFSVPADERVRVEMYATDGKLVSVLFEGNVSAGEKQFVEFKSGALADGMYFYRLITESGEIHNRKLILAR